MAEQWSIGGLARMARAFCDGTDPDGNGWAHDTISYSLLITATCP